MTGIDYSVFGRGKSVLDYQQLQQEFEAKKQLALLNQNLAIAQLGHQQRQEDRLNKTLDLTQFKTAYDMWNDTPHTEGEVFPGVNGFLPPTNTPQVSPVNTPQVQPPITGGALTPDSPIIQSIIRAESNGNPNAVSPKGAMGAMQLMPGTAKDLGVTAPFDPAQNIAAGTKYFNQMMGKYNDPTKALMAYNWGPGNVDKWLASGANPNAVPIETRNYVQKILASNESPTLGNGVQFASNTQSPVQTDAQPTNTIPTQEPANDAKPLYKGGVPYTTGAPTGMQWAKDSKGKIKAIPIEGSGEGAGGFKNENTLRDEFNTLTKDFRTVQDAYTKIKKTSNSGAGDMSMLYAYVKLLDPSSVVRESEFATAAASGSFGERIQGAAKSILEGGRLPPTLRQEFMNEAGNIYEGQKEGYTRIKTNYQGIAERNKLNVKNVITDYEAPADAPQPLKTPSGISYRVVPQ